jgi:hypothetical protein
MPRFAVLLCLCLAVLSPRSSAAQVGEVVTIEIQCADAKGPSPQEEAKALEELKKIILQDYIQNAGGARQSLLAAQASVMLQTPDAYLVGLTTSTRIFDAKTRRLTLGASAGIRTDAVSRLIDQKPAAAPSVPVVFIFVARRQSQVFEHDLQVTTAARSGADATASVGTGPNSARAAVSVGQSETTGGGGTLSRADTITYEVEAQLRANIDRTMSRIFKQRGLRIVPSAELYDASDGKLDLDDLQKDFRTSSEFSLKNRREITRVCRNLPVPVMLAYGTLTLGVKRLEAGSGATVVDVMVDAQVLDCRGPIAEQVASIGNVRVSGAGVNQTAAERTALDLAAERAANDIADQIKL